MSECLGLTFPYPSLAPVPVLYQTFWRSYIVGFQSNGNPESDCRANFQHTFWITSSTAGMQPIPLGILVSKAKIKTFSPTGGWPEILKINQIFFKELTQK